MSDVPLTRGMTAVVDEQDAERIAAHSWYAMKGKRTWYAASRIGGRIVLMHRFIMGEPVGRMVDHQDRDGLNNRRSNLRVATSQQNQANSAKAMKNGGFKGVYQQQGRYIAYIHSDKKKTHLGCFGTPEDAARAYDAEARKRWGEFARTNFQSQG